MTDAVHVDPLDLVVLAGGRGSRLGGKDKAALVVGGRPLLERLLTDIDLGGRVAVVMPGELPPGIPRPERVTRTLEDPPDGGPVAGIEAGLTALAPGAPWVAVAAVDQPHAAQALAVLVAALPSVPTDVDAVCQVDATGHRQWLLALYRRDALEQALAALPGVRDTSVKRLVSGLRWHEVVGGAEHLGDIDTWADAQAWARRL